MIITRNNFSKYFPEERYINVPRKALFCTFAVHMLIMFFGLLIFYNILVMIAVWVVGYELVHTMTVLRKAWKMSGYSMPLFFILFAVLTVAGTLLAAYVRTRLPMMLYL